MDPSTDFVIAIAAGGLLLVVQGVVALIAFSARQVMGSLRIELTRTTECLRHLEAASHSTERNIEEWKLKYSEAHFPLVTRIAQIEGGLASKVDSLATDIRTMLIQVPLLTQTVNLLDKHIQTLEAFIRDDNKARNS